MPSAPHPFIFFGTSRLSVIVLEQLAHNGYIPKAIITAPDSPQGRKLILAPTETKQYALAHNIPVYTYAKLTPEAIEEIKTVAAGVDFFLVASYGLIIPQAILDIPPHGVLNIHPSLLPTYRGATPLQQAILDDVKNTGVTIMQMDAKMDHGHIYSQEVRKNPELWPISYSELEKELSIQSVETLVELIDHICENRIRPIPQDHEVATFTKKITKDQGEIDINTLEGKVGYTQFLKYLAFEIWPGTFFFILKKDMKIRVKIKRAHWDNERALFVIETVIPEGQKEVAYAEFMKRIAEYY
jgi:methionyl-tRNA formyltransferase